MAVRSFRSVGASWAGNARFHPAAMLLMAAVVMASAASQATFGDDRAEPSAGLRYYDQGGVVVDGVAYFTSSDRPNGFPHVAAFRLPEMERIRTYAFAETYDSTPFVFQKRDGAWLVIAHEYKQARTVAISRDTLRPARCQRPNLGGLGQSGSL